MKKNLFYGVFVFVALQVLVACGNVAQESAETSIAEEIGTNEPKLLASYLQRNYDAWFELENQTVEYYRLNVAKLRLERDTWFGERELNVIIFEDKTDGNRSGFFELGDFYLPVQELKEFVQLLENVYQQMTNDVCRYNCTRRYATSFGVTITYNYSATRGTNIKAWQDVTIYANGEQVYEIETPYLTGYITGLKDCAQTIDDFVAGKWDNK